MDNMDTFITLEMDQTRELKWTFSAIKEFEKRSRELLKRLDVKNERGLQIANNGSIHAGYVLGNFGRLSDVMEAALGAAAGLGVLEGKNGTPSEAARAIDAYLEKGGSLDDLQRALFESYQHSNDPSSIAEWKAAIMREEEIRKINQEKKATQLEIAQEELKREQARLQELKNSGDQPTPLHT
ncbi:MAG TPA: hypothetical protein PLD96_03480 [Methanothrix sp.]|nr:hypothetical protein [Methanothrix sp.]